MKCKSQFKLNVHAEKRVSVNVGKEVTAKKWIPWSCSQEDLEETIQCFTSMDLETFCKCSLTLHTAGLITCRYSFPVKCRGEEPVKGPAEQVTGSAKETKLCADQTHWHILPFTVRSQSRMQVMVSLEKKQERFPVLLLSWNKWRERYG